MKTKIAYIFLLSLFAISSSCKKEKTNNDKNTETVIEVQKNDAEATKVYNLITNEINDVSATLDTLNYSPNAKTLDSCTTITINHPDTTTWPKIITINFSGNCTTENGNVLSGEIVIHQTARYRTEGMVRTITLNGLKINGDQVSGTKTITNLGLVNGFRTYSVTIENGSIITTAGEVIATRTAQRTRTWIEGESTSTRWDDVYLITGTTSGTTKSGIAYTATITEPLRVARNCRWIEQGKISTIIPDLPEVVIDFGNGTCDQTATVTVNENTRTITLH
jgi:hypothetical protein